MFCTCSRCGKAGLPEVASDNTVRCVHCGQVSEFKRVPLFFLSGASCSGKTTAAHVLFETQKEYITMECDILWDDHFNTPEDDYAAFRDTWLRLAANYAQYGKSTLLCGCITPEQIAKRPSAVYFSSTHYIAIVLSDEEMLRRLEKREAGEEHKKSSLDFNRWLRENGEDAGMTVIDATCLTAEETAERIHNWIIERL